MLFPPLEIPGHVLLISKLEVLITDFPHPPFDLRKKKKKKKKKKLSLMSVAHTCSHICLEG
jgi:hypothetical protein